MSFERLAVAPTHARRVAPGLPAFTRTHAEVAATLLTAAVVLMGVTVVPERLGMNLLFPTLGALALVVAVVNPRLELSLLAIAIYLTCVDGPLKLMSGNDRATILRDVLILAVVFGVAVRTVVEDRALPRIPYRGALLCLVLAVLVQAFNPRTPGIVGFVAGARQQLEFAPLLLLGVIVAARRDLLPVVGAVLLAVTLPNVVAAVIQSGLTPDQFASWGSGYADRVLGQGGFANAPRTFYEGGTSDRVRPFGLGSDAGAAGILGWLSVPFALAFLLGARVRYRVWLGFGGFALCAVAVLTSQSRGVFICVLVALLAFFAIRTRSRNAASTLAALGAAGVLIALFLSVFVATADPASLTRLKTVSPGQAASTIAERRGSLALVPDYVVSYPLGVGLGRSGPGSGAVGAPSGLDSENQFNFLIGELGILGLVAFTVLWLCVVRDAVRLARREEDERRRALWSAVAAALLAATAVWFQATPTTSTPIAPLFWLLAGVVGAAAMDRRARSVPG
ncbi:O-antigen ligase family protein [Paraconexibacter sp.]|uniref:O-antigen ligase family protein n=1 Tax=Paraconexibacter sp. TaxID=2949640 RepID=UPI003566E26B